MSDLNMDVFSSGALDNIMGLDELDILIQPEDSKEEDEPKEGDKPVNKEVITPPPSDTKVLKNTEKNPLLPFSKLLEERGFISIPDGTEIKDIDDIGDLLTNTIRERELSHLSDKQKEMLNWIESGIPEQDIESHVRFQQSVETITDDILESEDETGAALRKNILSRYYETKGFTETKINKLIAKFEESGEDIEESKEALAELKKLEESNFKAKQAEYAEAQKKSEESAKEQLQALKTFLGTTKEIVPGKTISQKEKDEIFNGLTKPVSSMRITGPDGKQHDRPLNIIEDFLVNSSIEEKAKLAYYIKQTEGFKKNDGFSVKKVKTQVEKEFEEAVRSSDIKEFQNAGPKDLSFLENAEF